MDKTHQRRPAWVEIDLAQLSRNFQIINRDKPEKLKILSVVKDNAYGHGAIEVARVALSSGAVYLATATVDEALELRESGISAPILIFGERTEAELADCIANDLMPCVNHPAQAKVFSRYAKAANKTAPVHLEIDTGMSRYGVRWTKAMQAIAEIAASKNLILEGVMSHFAMSDEVDKTFALLQLQRFQHVLTELQDAGINIKYRHLCNTGGFLDLPQAHFDMVRIGILPLGVYPSKACRRILGIRPIMSVKTRIAAIQELEPGDKVGYGMRYTAGQTHRIAVLPIGYGDGYPRVRNQGAVLIHGKRARIVGGNAMDAMMVDLSNIPEAKCWDEVVLMGKQSDEEISVHEIAALKSSVSYDILAGWRQRLPREYLR
ncbi:MAG: alanine racemase [bacterium]